MHTTQDGAQMGALLRTSTDVAITGNVQLTVRDPQDLVDWANVPSCPLVLAWRSTDTGYRYVDVLARNTTTQVHGHITARLVAEQFPRFWAHVARPDLSTGTE